jgi:hypothetical protein
MQLIGTALEAIAGLVSLVCFILVLVKMFQSGQTGLGIACIVLTFCCGIGPLIAFIFGWMRSADWNIRNIMVIWTVCWIIGIIGAIMNPAQFQQLQQFRVPGAG